MERAHASTGKGASLSRLALWTTAGGVVGYVPLRVYQMSDAKYLTLRSLAADYFGGQWVWALFALYVVFIGGGATLGAFICHRINRPEP